MLHHNIRTTKDSGQEIWGESRGLILDTKRENS